MIDRLDLLRPRLFRSVAAFAACLLAAASVTVPRTETLAVATTQEFGPGGDDTDGDAVRDAADDCPLAFDPEQLDSDDDGQGDACDTRPFGGREPPIRVVALSGQAAPGTDPGVIFSVLHAPPFAAGPLIDRNGRVAFRAELDAASVGADGAEAGIWVGRGANGLSKVVSERLIGADGPCTAAFPRRAAIGESGHFAFACDPGATGGSGETSLWLLPPGGELVEIARSGTPAPGTEDGTVFSLDFSTPAVGPDGRVSFTARAVGASIDIEHESGIWAGRSASSLALVVRGGTPAPGASGGRFADFGSLDYPFAPPLATASGAIVFAARLNPMGSGIWSAGAEGIRKVVNAGDPATGLPLTRFEEFLGSELGFSAAGERVTFTARLPSSGFGVWSYEPDAGLTLVAATGLAAPGLDEEGSVYGTLFLNPVVNAVGAVAFRADAGNDGFADTPGIWTFDPRGGLRVGVSAGQQVPSTEEGMSFGSLFQFNFDLIALNSRRQIAFHAFFSPSEEGSTPSEPIVSRGGTMIRDGFAKSNGGLGPDDESEGLFVFEPGRGLLLIARSGGLMTVGPGDLREVSSLGFVPGSAAEDGLGSGLNDRGEVAFAASFSDGSSGVFVARTGPLPCPGDCDDDGTVRIDELVRSVRVAARGADVFDCGAVDADEDGAAAVHELIRAVGASLHGCPD